MAHMAARIFPIASAVQPWLTRFSATTDPLWEVCFAGAWHGRVLPQVDRWSEKTQTQRRQPPRWHSCPWWLFCMSCPVHLCPHRRCHFKHFAFCSWQTCPTYLKRRHQRHQRHRRMEHSLLAGESRSKKCERSGSGTFVTADWMFRFRSSWHFVCHLCGLFFNSGTF